MKTSGLTLESHLSDLASQQPSDLAYVFYPDSTTNPECITYALLETRVKHYAQQLAVIPAGARVVIALSAGIDFICLFLACMRARLIAVPVAVPQRKGDAADEHLRCVLHDCQATLLIAPKNLLNHSAGIRLKFIPGLLALSPGELATLNSTTPAVTHHPGTSDIAYLQFTSGSTTSARGVKISHQALFEQLQMYQQRAGPIRDNVVLAGWLPHHHDFGLVGFILAALFLGRPYHFISPERFARRPRAWLELLSQVHATYSGAPPFAYELCARQEQRRPGSALNLSTWNIASVAGEPIAAESLRRFASTFLPYGFTESAFLPCYGLAEAVLCVTSATGLHTAWVDGVERACVGRASPGQSITIKKRDGSTAKYGQIGEVVVTGVSVATGYWQSPDATAATFKPVASCALQLYTGDLGTLIDGELYIVDRLKDIIIVRGENHSPHDIEATVQALDVDLVLSGGAVFQVHDSTQDAVVLVQEIRNRARNRLARLRARILHAVSVKHGIRLDKVVFVRTSSIPRTTSRKIRRSDTRTAYLNRTLYELNSASDTTPVTKPATTSDTTSPAPRQDKSMGALHNTRKPAANKPGDDAKLYRQVAAVWCDQLGLSQVFPDSGFFELGGDSLCALRVVSDIGEITHQHIDVCELLNNPKLAKFVAAVATRDREIIIPGHDRRNLPKTDVKARIALNASQHQILLLQSLDPEGGQALHLLGALRLSRSINIATLRAALQHVFTAEPALWRVIAKDDDTFTVMQAAEVPVVQVDGRDWSDAQLTRHVQRFRSRRFDLAAPMWRLELISLRPTKSAHACDNQEFPVADENKKTPSVYGKDNQHSSAETQTQHASKDTTPASHLLTLAVHHLVADGWSLNVLVTQIAQRYAQLSNDEAPSVPRIVSGKIYLKAPTDHTLTLRNSKPHHQTRTSGHQLNGQHPGSGQIDRHSLGSENRRPLQYQSQQHRLSRRYYSQHMGKRDSEGGQKFVDALIRKLDGQLPAVGAVEQLQRPDTPDFSAAVHRFELDETVTQRIRALSVRFGVTPFATLLATHLFVLHQLTGEDSVLCGISFAGRLSPDDSHAIGQFESVLPVLSTISDDPGAQHYIGRVFRAVVDALSQSRFTLPELLERLRHRVDPRRPVPIPTSFSYLPSPNVTPPFAFDFNLMSDTVTHHLTDLDVSVIDTGNTLRYSIAYNPDAHHVSNIKGIPHYIGQLLASADADAERPWLQTPLVDERHATLEQFQYRATPAYSGPNVLERFAFTATKFPNRIAIRDSHRTLTYRQLEREIHINGNTLNKLTGASSVVVAILAERSAAYLSVLLGTWWAGHVHLPLNPRDPAARIAQIITKADVHVVVVSQSLYDSAASALQQISNTSRPQILVMETMLSGQANTTVNGNSAPHSSVDSNTLSASISSLSAQSPAYIMFTSGSSGLPKGVAISHASMMNHLQAKVDLLKLTPTDRVAQTAAQTFDIAIWQFLAAGLAGAQVIVIDDLYAADPAQLLTQTDQLRITVLETIPSMLRVMLHPEVRQKNAQVELAALRWIIPTGEVLVPSLVKQWLTHFPRVPVINAYGPTECADDVAHHVMQSPPGLRDIRVPVGTAIRGANLYILNRHLQPVPRGAPGMLYVGGPCVGLGYIKDTARTMSAFLPDPFAEQPQARMYCTGDRARIRADGLIDFLGRADDQLKISGIRVEPAEIEQTLVLHPRILDAAITTIAAGNDTQILAAFLVAVSATAEPSREALRIFLRARLPMYQVPKSFTFVSKLPRTQSGKLDRAQLPVPQDIGAVRLDYSPPLGPVEKPLAEIFSCVLNITTVGRHEDLFDLGGSSVDVARISTCIADVYGVAIPLHEIFKRPTVAGIASRYAHAFGLNSPLSVERSPVEMMT